MIDIKGLDKAELLAALHQRSKAQGMGLLHDTGPLTVAEARTQIENHLKNINDWEPSRLYFDYVRGRVMKVDLSGDELDPRLYNRDVGEQAAEEVVARLRNAQMKGD